MSFVRTDSGLSNLHLFEGADAVVYLEGGARLSSEEIEKGNFSASSDDIRFWQEIFDHFRPDKRIAFKSIGSKTAVLKIAEKIEAGSVSSVIAVMDRDFDHLQSKVISHPNVLYTHGYSWENDCWQELAVQSAATSLCGTSKNSSQGAAIAQDVSLLYKKISVQLNRHVRMDAGLRLLDLPYFDRDTFQRYVLVRAGKPELNTPQLRATANAARTSRTSKLTFPGLTVSCMKDCYGHLAGWICYRILCSILSKNRASDASISKSYASAMVVSKLINAINQPPLLSINQHYQTNTASIVF